MAAAKWTASNIPPQRGKTALITGANSGIGYQTAVELARAGMHVMLGCRSSEKGHQAAETLQRAVPGATAEVTVLDMASLDSIRSVADAWRERPLDVLVNNAGVMALPSRELTADGFERQFGTNHLGHFALTGLLLPALLRAPAARVVTVASLAHRNGEIDFDNLQSERQYKPMATYNNSKLANLLFAFELERRARAAQVALRSVAAHPGVARTRIFENGPGTQGLRVMIFKAVSPFLLQSDAMGALPTLYAATAAEAQGGQYIGPDGFLEVKGFPKVVKPRPQALDEATARKLWSRSEELTGVSYGI